MTLEPTDLPRSRSRRDRKRLQRLRALEKKYSEAEHLSILEGLAADGDAMVFPIGKDATGLLAGPVQLAVGDRRLILRRVFAPAWKALSESVRDGVVTLASARRYGKAWAFDFEGPCGRLALLTDRVRLLPHAVAAFEPRSPVHQLVG